MTHQIGITFAPSTTQEVNMLIMGDRGNDSLKNQMVYFDVETVGGQAHRAIGFIHEITTENSLSGDAGSRYAATTVDKVADDIRSNDMRTVKVNVVSTFSQDENGKWSGQKPLPTSPNTGTRVFLAEPEDIRALFEHHEPGVLSYMGHLRGASDIPAPLILPYFGGSRGASSIGFVGKTGSGKTDFASKFVVSMMKYPDHFVLIVDPQGQWGNENGFTISPQKAAAAMGREVHNLRVAENIQLPLTEDNLIGMLTQVDLWSKLGRMAKENRDLLSAEVAELLCSRNSRSKLKNCTSEDEYRALLTMVLRSIVESPSTIARIYASPDKQDSFKVSLYELIDPAEASILAYIAANSRAIASDLRARGEAHTEEDIRAEAENRIRSVGAVVSSDSGDQVSDAENEAANKRWDGILSKFIPLMNLFQPKNLSGGARHPLDGEFGFLSKVLRVRNPKTDAPAPYVILDMSPDTTTKAKSDMLGGKDMMLNMRRLLDNDNIKASILMMIFSSLKESSEEAFASGGGNLNTQIVFDEAWRYAPDRSENPIIMELSKMLEGFALDTRKFGIGWTYILQSPTDLRHGIWKQLKFVFAGYGLVGADLQRMGDLMDDVQTQLKTYKQFVSPDLTGEYPFMMVGSVSPLITAQVPLFVNSYTSLEQFVSDNSLWLHGNMKGVGMPEVGADALRPGVIRKTASTEAPSHRVGGNATHQEFTSSYKAPENTSVPNEDDPLAPPF